MRTFQTSRQIFAACLIFSGASPGVSQESAVAAKPSLVADDPASRWVSVYGWMQTGDRLGEAGHWALAMGSYIESHRQLKALAEAHPTYETELVNYRIEKLAETIKTVDAQLSEDEHETVMTYLDFIESFELGLAQRFSNQYEASLATLETARSLLDSLIEKKPAEFRKSIQSQYERLEDNILWLSSQIGYKEGTRRRSAAAVAHDGRDRGTTRFVKREDLPDSSDGGMISNMLFPPGLSGNELTDTSETDNSMPVPKEEEQGEADAGKGSQKQFRLNSRE